MSEKRPYSIQCPQCGRTREVELYESLNIRMDPELRDLLMSNKINDVQCTDCDYEFRVDKSLLYCDPDRKLIIYLFPTSPLDYHDGEEKFSHFLMEILNVLPEDMKTPEIHLVFNRIELVERIFMIEAGLDPRIIEYIKYQIYSNNSQRVQPDSKVILFNAEDSNETSLCFVVQDAESNRFEAVLQYDRKTYNGLDEMFKNEEKSVDLLELFPGPYINARIHFLEENASRKNP